MRIALDRISKLSSNCVAIPNDGKRVKEVFVHYHDDQFVGYVVRFEGRSINRMDHLPVVLESFYVLVDHQVAGDSDTCPKLRYATVEVNMMYWFSA